MRHSYMKASLRVQQFPGKLQKHELVLKVPSTRSGQLNAGDSFRRENLQRYTYLFPIITQSACDAQTGI